MEFGQRRDTTDNAHCANLLAYGFATWKLRGNWCNGFCLLSRVPERFRRLCEFLYV